LNEKKEFLNELEQFSKMKIELDKRVSSTFFNNLRVVPKDDRLSAIIFANFDCLFASLIESNSSAMLVSSLRLSDAWYHKKVTVSPRPTHLAGFMKQVEENFFQIFNLSQA
jgi:hypothetical protein